jgi:hypothetical protein
MLSQLLLLARHAEAPIAQRRAGPSLHTMPLRHGTAPKQQPTCSCTRWLRLVLRRGGGGGSGTMGRRVGVLLMGAAASDRERGRPGNKCSVGSCGGGC